VATLNTTSTNALAQVREQFRAAVERSESVLTPTVAQALQSVLTAFEYEDRPLIRSHLETAISALTEAVGEIVDKHLAHCQLVRTTIRRLAAEIGGSPSEEFDQVGKAVARVVDNLILVLTESRDVAVRMKRGGTETPWESAVHTELNELEILRATLLAGWPWSHLPLPASDPAMLARSREQAQRGEGVSLDELIQQIEPEK
jgi:hypothetical protein